MTTLSLACASSSAAIAEAARAIALGECDFAIAGGVGADVDPVMFAAFGLLGALSEKNTSRPFDLHRDGFVLGEGAAFVVLSSERGDASVEVAGIGRSLDAHHITAPDPDGAGVIAAIEGAWHSAGSPPIDHVQAHGTSTVLNDLAEATGLRAVFGASLDHALVSSVKGALGHTIAAAGALGVLAAISAIADGLVLPTAGLTHPDPECALPHVMGRAVPRRVDAALVNSFGFGGANCCLVLRRVASGGGP